MAQIAQLLGDKAEYLLGNGERSFGSAKLALQHQRRGNTDNG